MHRRTFLAGVSAVVAGCSSREEPDVLRPTVTPVEVPSDPRMAGAAIPVGESQFGADVRGPDGVTCFHRLDDRSESAYVAPSRERFTPKNPAGSMYVTNGDTAELVVETGWELLKDSGHRWVPINAPQAGRSEISVLAPNDRWRRGHAVRQVFGLSVLGPGRYVRVESVRRRGDREPQSIGALFEVNGTQFRMVPRREPTARGDDVVRIDTGLRAEMDLVFERVDDAADAVELVPEAVGAIPMFRDSIPQLRDVSTVRFRNAGADVAFRYLDSATVRDEPVGPGDLLAVEDVTFTVRIVEHNR
ncbi:MAG: hypothetical protein RI568_04580 [Natronomonas sp.]|uniref:hypothetical protein n=1 Tax=Natronomonas sp. TaxID=2184060 RepID=UPI00286FC212|nr:hypothetical protein [Natronomonas sp.]MDR9429965.1 hypothetical protein [Natronomonas sp.]